jgi:hypothetical protein
MRRSLVRAQVGEPILNGLGSFERRTPDPHVTCVCPRFLNASTDRVIAADLLEGLRTKHCPIQGIPICRSSAFGGSQRTETAAPFLTACIGAGAALS